MKVIVKHTEAFTLELNALTRVQVQFLMDVMQNSIYGDNPENEPAEVTGLRIEVFNALKDQL